MDAGPDTESPHECTVLFDGHNMLFRYFWGMPRTITSTDGQAIHGAYGFVAAVIQHLHRFTPGKAIVCLDSEGPPMRTGELGSYKGNRQWAYTGVDENPFSQLRFIEEALSVLGVGVLAVPGVEADDLIATCTRRLRGEGHVYIASMDQDLLQLVDGSVSVYQRRGKREWLYSPTDIEAKYGVHVNQFIAWKALVGDASDNLRGVPMVGPATATMLLQRFGTLEAIYSNLDSLRPRLASSLRDGRDLAWRNIKLLTLRDEIEVEDVRLTLCPPPVLTLKVRDVFKQLGYL